MPTLHPPHLDPPRLNARRLRPLALPGTTVVALVATAVVPLLAVEGLLPGRDAALLLLAVAGVAGLAVLTLSARSAQGRRPGVLGVLRPAGELALHLSPVALLTLAFPIASARIGDVQVGGTRLTTLLLASSLTVPWLGQAVCLPLYRALGALILQGDVDALRQRFCRVWPYALLQGLPAAALLAVPVEVSARWSPTAFGAYLVLIVLHVAFAQSLVLANALRRRWLWAAAWSAYAALLLLAPSLWFLPPLAGLLTQLVPLRRHLRQLLRPVRLDALDVVRDLGRGLLLGSVLWADKFFLFLAYGPRFPVTTIFLAMLPAVLAYNYYFVRLAPRFDRAVGELRGAMEGARFGDLADSSDHLGRTVATCIKRTALLGALLGLGLTLLVQVLQPADTGLVSAVGLASWLFMMTTVVSYKLDYVGRQREAQWVGAAHLALCVLAFAVLPLGVPLYVALLAMEAVLFAVALRVCLQEWQSSEYTLFWRHATAW